MSLDFPRRNLFQPPKFDQYWQLHEEYPASKQELIDILAEAGYEVKKSAKKDELQSLVKRVRMGRLSYDTCSRTELKQFAVSRGLVHARKNPTKRWLADRLMIGDDHRSFAPIFDLPPEMRKLIYEFYLSEFNDDSLENPTQPPLARVCKTMRNEVLPLFYSTCIFDLKFVTMPPQATSIVRFRMDPSSFIFLATLAPGCTSDIRQLGIHFIDTARVLEYDEFWLVIDLNHPGLCSVECEGGNGNDEEDDQVGSEEAVEECSRQGRREGIHVARLLRPGFGSRASARARGCG